MRRQARTDTPYKVMCEIIESCIVGEKPPVHVYDMCLGDYQYLLHKIRVVTYGPEYNMRVRCSNCGEAFDAKINLDSLNVIELEDGSDMRSELTLTLPRSKKQVELNLQTPRMLDNISLQTAELKRKQKDATSDELGLVITLQNLIRKVDGEVLNPAKMENFVKNMEMMDVNYIIQKAAKLNERLGIDNTVIVKCAECGYDVVTTFRITSEFFGPSID